ncbi:MAG: ArsA family ATPase [Methanophagales archaeon]|nr:ArsA family ATPase [Methanophagales archaeon]
MRVIFYTGKGGSGKSVISSATALKLSELGYETLVISSDPAHTISDAFETQIQYTPTKTGGSDKLWAIQVDPIKEVREKYGVIQEYIVSLFKSKGLDEVLAYEIAALPNMTEFVSLLKVVEFVESNNYDVIVLDTVPSGEALKNIYLPTLLGSTATKLIKLMAPLANIAKVVEPIVGVPTPSKEVISEDIKLMEILGRLKNIIVDREVTSLRLIANPDAFSIQNLRRTHLLANLYDINVDLGIMNKVIPEKVSDSYFKEWKDAQEKYLAEAEAAFYPLPLKRLRLFQSEVKGLRLLSELGDELFGDEDPAKVYFEGKAIKVTESNYGLEVIVPLPLPFASKYKEVCEVERTGEDLSVVISTDVGEVRNFIPLPTIAHIMKLDRAELLNDELHIYFIDEKGDERG